MMGQSMLFYPTSQALWEVTPISVHWGCCVAEYHRLVVHKQNTLISHGFRGGYENPRSSRQLTRCLARACFLAHGQPYFYCILTWQTITLWPLFYKGINPSPRAPSSWPNLQSHFKRPPNPRQNIKTRVSRQWPTGNIGHRFLRGGGKNKMSPSVDPAYW